jgi:hypothetical protein
MKERISHVLNAPKFFRDFIAGKEMNPQEIAQNISAAT